MNGLFSVRWFTLIETDFHVGRVELELHKIFLFIWSRSRVGHLVWPAFTFFRSQSKQSSLKYYNNLRFKTVCMKCIYNICCLSSCILYPKITMTANIKEIDELRTKIVGLVPNGDYELTGITWISIFMNHINLT
jgi:hypothetical protein